MAFGNGLPAGALAERYRIEHELGAGGMATVYLAEDLRHERRVAIKVLRPELAAVIGADRFVREIRTIAALQHPHILGLIDSGEVDGTAYFVMPYVDGESLRDRLAREKQLPIGEAVRIACEVAGALDYAHRHGVIHRDIKPENILLHDGSALVADFGIALAVSKTGGARMTETGMSLGTPHYMSPEQAMGEREIDARSDVYALGAVAYEMLVGEPPFTGTTMQAIMARVMTEQPRPLTGQRRTVPPQVEAAVLTALEKLPADRHPSAAAFATALTAGPMRGGPARAGAGAGARRRISPALVAGVVAALAVGLVAGVLLAGRSGRAPPLVLGAFTRVTWDPGLEIMPAISPDGRSVAYAAGSMYRMQIFVRPVAGGRSIRLTDDSTGVQSHPSWSPDGSRVLFVSGNAVLSAPATGGATRPEVPPAGGAVLSGAAWAPDGERIVWTAGDSMFLRDADGTSRALAELPEPHGCTWSPSGALVACASGNVLAMLVGEIFGNISPSTITVTRVADGRTMAVTDSLAVNESPVWSADGHRVFFVSDRHGPRDVYAQAVSGDGTAQGAPVRITAGLNAHTFTLTPDERRLAFSSLVTTANIWSMALDGSETAPVRLTSGNQTTESSTLSADGEWLYYDSDVSGNMDLYGIRLTTGAVSRLTTDPADDFAPIPSPDGRELAFHSWRGGSSRDIYVMPLDGGPVSRITSTPGLQEALPAWSPDGNALAFCEFSARGGIWIARRVNGVWQPPVKRLDRGFWPVWSPDGRTLAFTTTIVNGGIAVLPVDSGAPRTLMEPLAGVTADRLFWDSDGRSLLFRGRGGTPARHVYRLPVGAGPAQARPVVRLAGADQVAIRGGWGLGRNRAWFSMTEREGDVTVVELAPRE